MTEPPVVVVGDVMVDVVALAAGPLAHASDTAARVRWTSGGAGANVAAGLARAGARVALVARAGDDAAGRALRAALRDAGVDARVVLDRDRPTGTCVVLVSASGERTMLPDRGANQALQPGDLPDDVFVAGAHLHLSGYVLLHAAARPAGLAALRRARAAGMTVSVDPASAEPLRACPPAAFVDWIRGADLVLPNVEEAAVLTGKRDPGAAAVALARTAQAAEVVVTLGASGALWTDGDAVVQVPAARADVLDSTGAGDAFAAAWLLARRRGLAPRDALGDACDAAAAMVGRLGAGPLLR